MSQFHTTSGADPSQPRPWWESDIGTVVVPPADPEPIDSEPATDLPVRASAVPVIDLTRRRPMRTPAARSHRQFRGALAAFLIMVVPALVGCLVGFLLGGATSIPPLAGVGLILGAAVAGFALPSRSGWFPVCLPPLAMLTVVAVAGQVTLIGSRPTAAREATMVMANLAVTAPAQLGAMAVLALILFLRRRRSAA